MKSFAKRLRRRITRLSLAYLATLTLVASIGISVGTQGQAFALPNPLAQTNTIANSPYVLTSTWCAPESFQCFAVGYDVGSDVAVYGTLVGSQWTFTDFSSTFADPNANEFAYSRLNSVSCADASHCIAVGVTLDTASAISSYSPAVTTYNSTPLVLQYINGTWSDVTSAFASGSSMGPSPFEFNSVSCTPSSCMMVGGGRSDSGIAPVLMEITLQGGNFQAATTLNTPYNYYLGIATNIACTTTSGSSLCEILGLQWAGYATGISGADLSFNFDPTNAASTLAFAIAKPLPIPASDTANSVNLVPQSLSCPTTFSCFAIVDSTPNTGTDSILYALNSQSVWSIAKDQVAAADLGGSSNNDMNFSLTSLDCSTSTSCLIGGTAHVNNATSTQTANPLVAQVNFSTANPTFTPVDFSTYPSKSPSPLISSNGTISSSAITCGGTFNCTIFSSFQGSANNSPVLFESYVGAVPFASPPTFVSVALSSQFSNQGFTLTVTGNNLLSVTSVYFGSAVNSNVVISPDGTMLTASFPAQSAGAYSIVLNYPGGSVNYTSQAKIIDPPTITAITPTTAIAGTNTNVVITGTNLSEVAGLTVAQTSTTSAVNSPFQGSNTPVIRASSGANPVINYKVVSSSQIDATLSFSSAGNYLFELAFPGGTVISNPTSPFTILTPPQVSVISPIVATTNAQPLITVNGTNLNEITSISVGGITVTPFTLVSPTIITFKSPNLAAGSYPIVLNFNGGQVSNSNYTFQVTQPSNAPSQTGSSIAATTPALTPNTTSTNIRPASPANSQPSARSGISSSSQSSTTTTAMTTSAPSQQQPGCAISGLCTASIISGTYQFTTSNGQTFDLSVAPTSTRGTYLVTSPTGVSTTMSLSGSNFTFTNSSLITAFPRGVELAGLSEQNGILVGHFIQKGVSTYSFTAKFVSSALFGKAPQLQISSIALSLPSPFKVFKSAKRDIIDAILAVLLVLYISFTSEFFNAALGEKYEEFRRAMRRKTTTSRSRIHRHFSSLFFNSDVLLPQSIVMVIVVMALGATIGIFLDPAAGFNLATLYSWLAIAVSVSLGPTISSIGQNTYRKMHGLSRDFRLRAIPLGLFIAVLAVAVSRFIHFQPGYLYGIVIGVVYYDKVKEHQEGHISTLNGVITLAVGITSWLLWIPVHDYAIRQTGATFASFLADIFASVFVTSIVGALVTSLPLGALPGKKIFRWKKGAWVAFMTVVVFLLVSVAATPLSTDAAANHSPLITIVAAVLLLGGVAIVLARIFIRIEDREEILEELEEEEIVHKTHDDEAEEGEKLIDVQESNNTDKIGHEH